MKHELKTWPDFYQRVHHGEKTFEARRNDRGFQKGDILVLREWCPERHTYTGRRLSGKVGYVLTGEQFGIRDGYCVMSIVGPITTPRSNDDQPRTTTSEYGYLQEPATKVAQ